MSLLNISRIFLNLVYRLFICNSILCSTFWFIFTIIIRNSLSGRVPISSSFVWFGGHLSCCFTCWVFLCPFILYISLCLGGLSVFWQFVVPLYCGGSSLWVGLDGWPFKVSWLGKLFWCSGGWSWIPSLWSAVKCPAVSSERSGFGVTLGSLHIGAQGCAPVLLENLRGVSCSGACWPLGGAWFQCRYGGV